MHESVRGAGHPPLDRGHHHHGGVPPEQRQGTGALYLLSDLHLLSDLSDYIGEHCHPLALVGCGPGEDNVQIGRAHV